MRETRMLQYGEVGHFCLHLFCYFLIKFVTQFVDQFIAYIGYLSPTNTIRLNVNFWLFISIIPKFPPASLP